MSTRLKEILTKNGPYPTPLNPISSQAKAVPGLAPAMLQMVMVQAEQWPRSVLAQKNTCIWLIMSVEHLSTTQKCFGEGWN